MGNPEFRAMFTGIIEALGTVERVLPSGTNRTFWIASPLSPSLKPDQSVAHNGVCLTVEEVTGTLHRVTAVSETLDKTDLGAWAPGRRVNLERSLLPTARIDGHFVQGHVDTTGTLLRAEDKGGSREFTFSFPEAFAPLLIEKGSVALNGISLTTWNLGRDTFTVAIIPFTLEHTNLSDLTAGDRVNLEFDPIGKYLQRRLQLIS